MNLVSPSGYPLTERNIQTALASNGQRSPVFLDESGLRRAAVLVPIIWQEEDWHLLYIRRTDHVQLHKGQVAFPGGGVEPEDLSPEDTALRESWEEIGLMPENVRILGRLPELITISSYIITPVVGRILQPYSFQLQPEEVSRVFTIPISWLVDRANYEERLYSRPNGVEEIVVFYQLYQGEQLWGITGRITLNFLTALSLI